MDENSRVSRDLLSRTHAPDSNSDCDTLACTKHIILVICLQYIQFLHYYLSVFYILNCAAIKFILMVVPSPDGAGVSRNFGQ